MANTCFQRPKLSDFSFNTTNECSVFHRPQWAKFPQIVFAVYRVVLAIYVLGFLLGVIVISVQHQGAESFIYLTTYGFMVFTTYNATAAFNVIFDGCIRRHSPVHVICVHHKIHWFLFNITTNINFLVTIVYWSVIYTPSLLPLIYDLNMHTLTSVVCLVDLFLTAIPIRFLHFIYPLLFGTAYLVFTLIFWAAGGSQGEAIYPFLDYSNKPGQAAGVVIGIFIAVIIMQGIMWVLYRLRLWIWIRCGHRLDFVSVGEEDCFLDDDNPVSEECEEQREDVSFSAI